MRYLLLSGWALGLYGNPRATKDIDFLIAVDNKNLSKLQSALKMFGAPFVKEQVFKKPGNVFRLGHSPVQIDIINEASGIEFQDAYKRRNSIAIENIEISDISKKDLIINKKASGRSRDLADVEDLDNDK